MMEKKSVYYFIIVIVSMLCVVSCVRSREDKLLDRAVEVMEDHPDSALSLLEKVDKRALTSGEQRARYALLMSAALDKNGIDTTTFDIIRPAIDYYEKEGNPDDRLRTLYYQGRIYQNRGERNNALSTFYKALNIASQCHDSLTIARTLVAQAYTLKELYDIKGYINNHLRASAIYECLSKSDLVIDCYLNAFDGAILLENKALYDSLLSILDNKVIKDDNLIRIYRNCKISYFLNFGSSQDIDSIIYNSDKYSWDINGMMNLALAHNKRGDNETGLQLLDYISSIGEEYDTLKYQAVKVSILENMGNHKEALLEYKSFTQKLDSINKQTFNITTAAINDKHEIELNAEKKTRQQSQIIWTAIVLIIILTTGTAILIVLAKSNKTKKLLALAKAEANELENARLKSEQARLIYETENLSYKIKELEEESTSLKKIIAHKNNLPVEIHGVVKTRIEMLNSLLASHITADDKHGMQYEKWVNNLTDNIFEFMNTTRMAFQVSHPEFIEYFEDHGLTNDEINYVCLYAIGLNGKEVGNYIKKPSHVNMSSAIRKKLGIDKHDTNIGIYVRRLLKNS